MTFLYSHKINNYILQKWQVEETEDELIFTSDIKLINNNNNSPSVSLDVPDVSYMNWCILTSTSKTFSLSLLFSIVVQICHIATFYSKKG